MKNLIKIIAFVLVLTFVFVPFASCNKGNDGNDTTTTGATTTAPNEPTDETTAADNTTTEGGDETTATPEDTTTTTNQGGAVVAPEDNNNRAIRVLFIGNSLTFYNDMPKILMELGKAVGKNIYTERATVGSSTMCQQISTTTEVGQKVANALKQKWDYIVVQPSRRNTEYENTVYPAELTASDTLNQMIRNNGATPIIYGTWGNNCGYIQVFQMNADGINTTKLRNENASRKTHNDYMRTINEVFSKRMDAPVVDAAHLFEYMVSEYPEVNMYHTDERHPSLAGSFAVACQFFSYFYNESAEAAAALHTAGLEKNVAQFLAQAADHIVRGSSEPTIDVGTNPGVESTITVSPVQWTGSGTQADPYIIANAGNFMYMANLSYEGETFEGKYIKQTADVDLAGGNFVPIGITKPFKGTYEGGGHQIATFAVTAEKSGIFAQTEGANISGIKSFSITFVGTYVGGIIGEAKNTVVSDCILYQSSSVEGSERVGGIVGSLLEGSTVKNCVNFALVLVKATDHCYGGGIVGLAAGGSSIENCYNVGDVNIDNKTASKNACGGGILGCSGITSGGAANVTRCINEGIILFEYDGGNSTRAYTGGIIGRAGQCENEASVITECYNYGDIVNSTSFMKYFGIGQMCGVFVNPNVTFVGCFGLDTISTGLNAKYGPEFWGGYTNYVAGKEGQKFTDAQKYRISENLGVKTKAELDALTAAIRAGLPQW